MANVRTWKEGLRLAILIITCWIAERIIEFYTIDSFKNEYKQYGGCVKILFSYECDGNN